LLTLGDLPTSKSRAFARCALLRVGQWALDGRRKHTTLTEFRGKFAETVSVMVEAMVGFSARMRGSARRAVILNLDATALGTAKAFKGGRKAKLVVTSPPY